ncbi:hypothetical protein HDK64DRAFT_314072 [Phyllosticta capitalensis]
MSKERLYGSPSNPERCSSGRELQRRLRGSDGSRHRVQAGVGQGQEGTANYKVCSSASDCCSGVCEGQMEVGTVCKPASAKVKRCTANYKVCSSASDCCSGKCEGQMEVGTVCKP